MVPTTSTLCATYRVRPKRKLTATGLTPPLNGRGDVLAFAAHFAATSTSVFGEVVASVIILNRGGITYRFMSRARDDVYHLCRERLLRVMYGIEEQDGPPSAGLK